MSQVYNQMREESSVSEIGSYVSRSASLPAKGSCWYCDKALDNVRRFCSSTCRDDYFEEQSEFPD